MMIFDVILHEKVHGSKICHYVEIFSITGYWIAVISHISKHLQHIQIFRVLSRIFKKQSSTFIISADIVFDSLLGEERNISNTIEIPNC